MGSLLLHAPVPCYQSPLLSRLHADAPSLAPPLSVLLVLRPVLLVAVQPAGSAQERAQLQPPSAGLRLQEPWEAAPSPTQSDRQHRSRPDEVGTHHFPWLLLLLLLPRCDGRLGCFL